MLYLFSKCNTDRNFVYKRSEINKTFITNSLFLYTCLFRISYPHHMANPPNPVPTPHLPTPPHPPLT